MKTKIIFITSILSCSVITVFAQAPSDDFFPLAVGNSWTYNYYAAEWEQLGAYFVSDSGAATYKIISKSLATDSIIWNIREIRNIIHKYISYDPTTNFHTSYAVCDSTTFSIIEYLNNNHRLVSMASNWECVFYFRSEFADSDAFLRYYPSQVEDTFTVALAHYFDQEHIAQVYNASFQRHIGLTMVAYSAPGFEVWVPWTYHTLNSSFRTSVESGDKIVLLKDFVLYQNYPNPFNPSTNITFSIPTHLFVTLKIHDILGREVAIIVSEKMSAGIHFRQWNATKMSSGIYFCRLQAGSYSETKKIILFK